MTLDFLPPVLEPVSPPSGDHHYDDYSDTDTLADLLAQLGHRCRGEGPLAETCRVLRAVNNCVRDDHIRVVHGDKGR